MLGLSPSRIVAVALGTAVPAFGHGAVSAAPGAGESIARCVRWRGEARYRNYGYDHLVHIRSECSEAVVCTVTTDVAPEPVRARVAPGREVTVLTFRGSPARKFEANVACRFSRRAP